MLKLTETPFPRRLSASQRVSRKYKKDLQRKMRKAEYKRLKAIVPSIARREKVQKITVIEEAIKYIDDLHFALLKRLQLLPAGARKSLLGQIPPQQIVRQIAGLQGAASAPCHLLPFPGAPLKAQHFLKAQNCGLQWES